MSKLINPAKHIQSTPAQRPLDFGHRVSVHHPKIRSVNTAATRKNGPYQAHTIDRRQLGVSLAGALGALAVFPPRSDAVQGNIAGRIPGVTGPDKDGYYTYTRPEGKSGGHGVGWSEIPRYSFKVPEGWDEVPVSIADLGGTEIDLRYGKEDCGSLFVVVAPVLRFADVGYNANIRIDELGEPERIISGFAPELFGSPLVDGDILSVETVLKNGVPYYNYEVKRHHLVSATAVGNRLFILATSANSRQWRKGEGALRKAQQSFSVPNV